MHGSLHDFGVEFPLGLPGFETYRRFTLIQQASSLFVLKSIDLPHVRFHAIPVSILVPEYQLGINEEHVRFLGLGDVDSTSGSLLCLAILSGSADGTITANLLAPVIIHLSTGLAVQAVRSDNNYSHRHVIRLKPSQEAECL